MSGGVKRTGTSGSAAPADRAEDVKAPAASRGKAADGPEARATSGAPDAKKTLRASSLGMSISVLQARVLDAAQTLEGKAGARAPVDDVGLTLDESIARESAKAVEETIVQAYAGDAALVCIGREEFENLDRTPIRAGPDGQYDLATDFPSLFQGDDLVTTTFDAGRCSCQSLVGSLVAGGRDRLLEGIEQFKSRPEIAADPQKSWMLELISLKAKGNDLSAGHLHVLADMLANHAGRENPSDKGGLFLREVHDAIGTVSTVPKNITMNRWEDVPPKSIAKSTANQEIIAADLMEKIKPGERILVGVNLPWDKHGGSNHVVLLGKQADGTPYLLDSGKKPPFTEGYDAVKVRLGRSIPGSPAGLQADFAGPIR